MDIKTKAANHSELASWLAQPSTCKGHPRRLKLEATPYENPQDPKYDHSKAVNLLNCPASPVTMPYKTLKGFRHAPNTSAEFGNCLLKPMKLPSTTPRSPAIMPTKSPAPHPNNFKHGIFSLYIWNTTHTEPKGTTAFHI